MLILQRRVGQRIVVGDGIEITVIAISKGGIRLAVNAPRGIPVIRGEVHDAVAAANALAASQECDLDAVDAAAARPESPQPPEPHWDK
jgi:carbon storage regulator